MSTTPTILDLQTEINLLTARLNLIDGQNLAPHVQGFTAQTNAAINGLKQDINGSVLALEADLNHITTSVQILIGKVNALLGLTGVASLIPPTVCPPTT